MIDVGWVVWGDQWKFWLDDLSGQIATPDGSDPTEAWVSSFEAPDPGAIAAGEEPQGTRELGVDAEISDGEASFEAERVPEAHDVVLRALVPRDAVSSVSGARVVAGDGAEKVTAQEDDVSDTFLMKARNFVFDNAWLVFGLWTLLVVALSFLLAMMARERPTDVGEYLNEPPEDLPPAIAYALATEGQYDDRVVLATLLSLVDRGYYDAKASQGDELDLELSVAADRPAVEALQPFEVTTMTFFDDLLGGKTVALGKLKDEIPEHSATWRSRWNGLTSELDQADEGTITWDRDFAAERTALAFVALLGYLILGWLFFSRTHWLAIPAGTAVLGPALRLPPAVDDVQAPRPGGPRARRPLGRLPPLDRRLPAARRRPARDPEAVAQHPRLRRRLRNRARRSRSPAGSRAPVGEEATNTGSWTAFALYGGVWSSDFNSFGSGFSSQVAPQSSSSGGGGGFSGGGGGSSGGGGGGAW